MPFGSHGRPKKRSLSQCHGVHDPFPAYGFRFTPVGTFPKAHQGIRRDAPLPHKSTASVKTEGLACASCPQSYEHKQSCPGVARLCHNLTFFPRPPKYSPGPKAADKTWIHHLAPTLQTPRYRATTSNRGTKAKPDSAWAAPSRITVSPWRLRKRFRPHTRHQTWDLDQDLNLNLGQNLEV